jgi:peptidoglycan-N-acetylglucosamine deacetylase
MKLISWFIISIFLLAFISCKKITDPIEKGGIVITFDDDHVSDWYLADSILSKYHWKATFCVSHIDKLTTDEIHMLHVLQDAGHEIAGHGLNHLDAVKYVAQFSIPDYLNQEIIPMIDIMKEKLFTLNSFAYPYGRRNKDLDSVLLNYFKILRGITLKDDMNCYFSNSPIVVGTPSDSVYVHSEKYIFDFLKNAKRNGKILIVYSHTIHNLNGVGRRNVLSGYYVKNKGVDISTLIHICNYIKENNMEYYTLSDLSKLLE